MVARLRQGPARSARGTLVRLVAPKRGRRGESRKGTSRESDRPTATAKGSPVEDRWAVHDGRA